MTLLEQFQELQREASESQHVFEQRFNALRREALKICDHPLSSVSCYADDNGHGRWWYSRKRTCDICGSTKQMSSAHYRQSYEQAQKEPDGLDRPWKPPLTS